MSEVLFQTFLKKVRWTNILYDNTLDDKFVKFECAMGSEIRREGVYVKLFFEHKNHPTKFVYNYHTSNYLHLWEKLNV